MKKITWNPQLFAESSESADVVETPETSETESMHTPREVELEQKISELETKLNDAIRVNQQMYVKLAGKDETPSRDPSEVTDEFLTKYIASHFNQNFLKGELTNA